MLFHAGDRAIPIRDALRERGVLIRDRSYEIPGCVRVTIGTRAQIERFLDELENLWSSLIVFDMDGVLAEVTESYRESIVQTVGISPEKRSSATPFRTTRTKAAGIMIGRFRRRSRRISASQIDYDTVIEKFNESFLGENGNGLVQRESWFPQAGPARTPGRALWTGDLHRTSAL